MKYIKTYESFKSTKYSKIEEGLLGNLFGKLKNKLSLGFSKMFGSASEVDKIISEYKNEILKTQEQKKLLLKNYGSYLKSVKDGGEKDENKIKQIKEQYKKVDTNTNKQLGIVKQKFDLKLNAIVKEEKNPKIKDFIELKKLELQQELLQDELSFILKDNGLKEEDLKDDSFFQDLSKAITIKIEDNNKKQEENKKSLSEESSDNKEVSEFNFEEAKKDPKNYKWEDSKFVKDYKFEAGEEIKYLKSDGLGDDGKGTTAWVMDKQEDNDGNPVKGGEVRVTTNKEDKENKGFVIAKSKVISTVKDDKAKEEKSKEEPKEEPKEESEL